MSSVDFGRYKRMVRYFWDPQPKNDDGPNVPIWCLGKRYDSLPGVRLISATSASIISDRNGDVGDESHILTTLSKSSSEKLGEEEHLREEGQSDGVDRGWPKEFLDDFESRIWFTYRSNFPAIKKSSDTKSSTSVAFSALLRSQAIDHGGFTSDTGWGCMIRSGQSLLANALIMLQLGRDWRRGTELHKERHLLSLFADDPEAPFSIHKFVQHGASDCGKSPGEWFGPSATARCIEALSAEYPAVGLKVYLTGDGPDVYEDAFFKIATADNGAFTPTLILVGIRLGIDRVTPAYWEALKKALHLPQSVGIAGGRPSSSHYFVATQGNKFFYLDPHLIHSALPIQKDASEFSAEDVNSCHTRRLRRLSIEEMDPSMLIGFLIQDKNDWKRWREINDGITGKPVIHVADNEPLLLDNTPRRSTVDEVETFDDEVESDNDVLERP